jgi:effector-binding domain-containing protein
MITEPQVEYRDEQNYVGIRTRAAIPELPTVIPQLHSQVYARLREQGVDPSGPPFIRYYVIDMVGELDIELGVPIDSALPGEGRVQAGVLPAGRYATLIYTGDYPGLVGATAALLQWADDNGIVWQTSASGADVEWGARVEFYLTDPAEESDPAKWETELAFLVA